MAKNLISFLMLIFPLFAYAEGCANGTIYTMSGGSYIYQGTLQARGMASPAEFQAYLIDLLVSETPAEDLQLSFTFNNVTFDPSNAPEVSTLTCTGLLWTVSNFGQVVQRFVFDQSQSSGGGGGSSDGDFPSFYLKSSRSLSSVIGSFKTDVKNTELFTSIGNWFQFNSYSTSCPDFSKSFDVMGQGMTISFNDVFCGDTGDLFFTVLKAVFLFAAVVGAIGIAFL